MKFRDKLFELKIEKSKQAITNEIERQRSKTAVLWTTGRDSTSLLYLIKEIYGRIPIPTLFPDTGLHFRETYEFRDRIVEVLQLNIIVAEPTGPLDKASDDRELCCYRLITEPLLRTMKRNRFRTLITPFRWQSNRISMEHSLKTSIHQKRLTFRNLEPITHWTGKDIQRFTEERNIPLNPLYAKGYQNIPCRTCKFPTPKPKEIPNADDAKKIMKRLRKLGYL